MDEKHTPGPWVVDIDEGQNMHIISSCEIKWDIARAYNNCGPGEATRANACLIAAAPDMHEACKAALGWFSGDELTEQDLLKKLKAAIAKAEGTP